MDKGKPSERRRSPEQIIDAIFAALPSNSYEPVLYIARKAKLDWKTCKRYLNLMTHIFNKQEGVWLEQDTIGSQEGYRRKGLKRGPRGPRKAQ